MKSKKISGIIIIVFLLILNNILFAQKSSIRLNARGGWNNYDLQSTGWTTYSQFGIEKVNSDNSFGYGLSLLIQKTNQYRNYMINSYHYIPELFVSKTFYINNIFCRLGLSSGVDIAKREYYRDIGQQYTQENLNVFNNSNTKSISHYAGSIDLSVGYKVGNFIIGPNLSIRAIGYGINTETGIFISGIIF